MLTTMIAIRAGAGLEPNGVQQPSDQGSDQTQRDSAEPQPFLMQQDTGTGSTGAGPAVFPWQPAVEDDTACKPMMLNDGPFFIRLLIIVVLR